MSEAPSLPLVQVAACRGASQQIREQLQLPDRRDETLPRQRCEILFDAIRWLQKPRPHFAHSAADDAGRKAQLIAEKFIRVLRFNLEGR